MSKKKKALYSNDLLHRSSPTIIGDNSVSHVLAFGIGKEWKNHLAMSHQASFSSYMYS